MSSNSCSTRSVERSSPAFPCGSSWRTGPGYPAVSRSRCENAVRKWKGISRSESHQRNGKQVNAYGADSPVDFGLFDLRTGAFPTQEGIWGWCGGACDSLFLVPGDATPGYVAGENLPGCRIIPLRLVFTLDSGLPFGRPARVANAQVPVPDNPETTFPWHRRPGWYRSNSHAHTIRPDAKGAPEVLHVVSKIAGLDILFMTDHNNMKSWSEYFQSKSSEGRFFQPGMEITSTDGHANPLGISRSVDIRTDLPGDPAMPARRVVTSGGLLSVNRDKLPVSLRHRPPRIDFMEVWQRHGLAGSEVSLMCHGQVPKMGRCKSATGGSNCHHPTDFTSSFPCRLGKPMAALCCEEVSQDMVMRVLMSVQGHATEAPNGPLIVPEAVGTGKGDVLPNGFDLSIRTTVPGASGNEFLHVCDEGEIARQAVDGTESAPEIPFPQEALFVRSEIQVRADRNQFPENDFSVISTNGPPSDLDAPAIEPAPFCQATSNPNDFGIWNQ